MAASSVVPFSTCDFCDVHKGDETDSFRWLTPVFQDFGGLAKFSGCVSTVQCHEDNTSVKAAVESAGHGRVLVVDGGGSLRRALVGGNLAASAACNGWAGLVVYGCVRDVAELRTCLLGIRALALVPMPTQRRRDGLRDVRGHVLPLVQYASRHFLGHRTSDEELRTALVRKKRQKIKHAIADALHPCSKYNARRALFFTGKEGCLW